MLAYQIHQFNLFSDLTGRTGKNLSFFTLADLQGRQLLANRPRCMAEGPDAYLMEETGVQTGNYYVTVSTAAMQTVTEVTSSIKHD